MSMGRSSFTPAELIELRRLIREKQTADAPRQKVLRARMRRMGFYISDFSADAGFVVSDLDELVSRGTITIVDDSQPAPEALARAAIQVAQARKGTRWDDAPDVTAALTAEAVDLAAALRPQEAGGLPSSPGFYAWWAAPGAIAGAPHHPHPLDAELGL